MNASWQVVARNCLILVLCWNGLVLSAAACTIPWPDTYRSGTSKPNVVGKVISVGPSQIELQTKKGNQRIELPRSGIYYTAFGGDDKVDKLKLGIVARAWYVDCKLPKRGSMPRATYLEVYSNDPNDQPPATYWQRY